MNFAGYDVNATDMSTLKSEAEKIRHNLLILMIPFNMHDLLPAPEAMDRLPQTIFANRTMETYCRDLSFQDDKTQVATDKLRQLSKSDYEAFVSNMGESNIFDLLTRMEAYADAFVMCTSIYSSYLSQIDQFAQWTFEFSSMGFTLEETFNYEVDSQVIIELIILKHYLSHVSSSNGPNGHLF